ncbi:MAG: hypothetical protein DME21_09950 [Verrucomicrobia bacterium]|nr:MAG: hypothetical protein DME21_09950 [Verrucomicrobiota bacterium]
MKPYADTNFFTRLYLQLEDTPQALRLAEGAEEKAAPPLPVTWLHRVEFINAVQQHVFVGLRGQIRVTAEQAAIAMMTFREDLAGGQFLHCPVLDLADLERHFEELSLRHTARHGFRTYDLLHVSSALILKCDVFWSFDPKASKLAALEGFKVRR